MSKDLLQRIFSSPVVPSKVDIRKFLKATKPDNDAILESGFWFPINKSLLNPTKKYKLTLFDIITACIALNIANSFRADLNSSSLVKLCREIGEYLFNHQDSPTKKWIIIDVDNSYFEYSNTLSISTDSQRLIIIHLVNLCEQILSYQNFIVPEQS